LPFRSFLARFLSVLAFLCLTAVLHAEVSVGLASFADDSQVHIVYPAADRHVNQIIWTGTAWVDQDLTAAAGNPALTGWGSPLMSYSYGGWRYIAYVDTNQHINQMVWTGAAWVNQDLTAAGGSAALAATGSALANLADGNGPHIIYVDTVQHVNQLIWTGTAWVNQDLTAAAGSPVAVSAGSGLAGVVDGSRVNIAYIDSNQHLSQLLWTGTQWVNQDLTAASGAPSPRRAAPSRVFFSRMDRISCMWM
jgi:hypothetical protein